MDMNILPELIGTLGFPIVCVIGLGIFIFKIWQQSVIREEKLMTEITENREVNTKAIETISQFAGRFTYIEDNITEIREDVAEIKNIVNN